MLTGFSPRKRTLTVYIMSGFAAHRTLLPKLGPHSTGASCLYIKRLEDIDLKVLTAIIKNSVARLRKRSH
jgi:hypothetical protein